MPARVLVVDDHPLTRDALAALLRSHGFELAGIAADGEEAIAAAAETQPDLVLLDLLMPGLDGLTALPRLREAAPGCEVVILTASGTEENLLAAIRGGAAGYLLKTESPDRIAEFLEGVVQGDAALSAPWRAGCSTRCAQAAAARAYPTASRRSSPRGSSRCCCCSTSTTARMRSLAAYSSPSTRFART